MLLIKNANLLTMDERDYMGGDLLIGEDGRIAAVGFELPQQGARVIDGTGLWAVPGLIDAHCHVGMWEDGMGREGADGNEATDPVTPQLRAIDAVNPLDPCFSEALHAGVTTVCTGPGSANVVGGQFCLLSTHGRSIEQMLIKEPSHLKAAFGENPKRCYGEQKKTPSTRMGTAAILRQAFVDAQSYMEKQAAGEGDPSKAPSRDLKLEALAAVLRGEIPLKCHAHRVDDILTAIRVCREFCVRYTLDHVTEGYMIADELLACGAPVIIGPLFSERSKIELRNMTFKAPALLAQAGVRFAMMTDHPVIPLQYLLVSCTIAMREGLPEREALACVTRNAAEFCGLGGRKGALAAGLDGDIALFDAHPLDMRAHARMVFVGGAIVHEA